MAPTGRPDASADPAGSAAPPVVELGSLVNVHGIRGELRLLPYNPDSTLIGSASELILQHRDGRRETRRVRQARRHKRFVLVTLDGIDSATAAEALVGCRVSVPRAALPPPGAHAVYHADLLGCTVQTVDGTALGQVAEMLVTPSNDVCVVRNGTREYLIPMIADVIAAIDLTARRIAVRPLPGLLDDGTAESAG